MPVDLDLDLGVEPACDRMRTARVDHTDVPRARRAAREVEQELIELAQRGRREIHDLDGRVLTLGDRHQTTAFSHAYTTPGSGSHASACAAPGSTAIDRHS